MFSKKNILKKLLTLKTDSAASNEEHVKPEYFVYFPWPPLEA
jgi:hypothetical protein